MRSNMGPGRGWWRDEVVGIGRENVDDGHVARYDDKEDAEGPAEVRWLQEIGVAPASTVVDLGAGTGQFALAAAEVFLRVVAVDPSPVMLDLLRRKARRRSAPVEIVAGGFLTYEHTGPPPELVYSRFALHHLPDFWKVVALRRIRAMLRPGGLFRLWDVVFDFAPHEVEERVERWCASVPAGSDDPVGSADSADSAGSAGADAWTRAELEEHVRDEHSTFTWLLEPMILRSGFAIREATRSDDGVSARYLLVAV